MARAIRVTKWYSKMERATRAILSDRVQDEAIKSTDITYRVHEATGTNVTAVRIRLSSAYQSNRGAFSQINALSRHFQSNSVTSLMRKLWLCRVYHDVKISVVGETGSAGK